MLYGPITLKQLYFDYPEWQQKAAEYQVDPAVLDDLKKISKSFEVKIFLGTWCSDSRREVPHFFKIMESADLMNKARIEMWAVDRKLNLDDGLNQKYDVKRVATFIFLKDGKEIGRIIESPESFLLEEDVLKILSAL